MASSLRYALLLFLVVCGLAFLLTCDIMGPEEEAFLRVWWVEMPDSLVQEGQTGLFFYAYSEHPDSLTWSFHREWREGHLTLEGQWEPGVALQLPTFFLDEEWSQVTFWGQNQSLGPDTVHYEHLAQDGG